MATARYFQGFAFLKTGEVDPASAVPFHEGGIALARSAHADLAESQNLQGLIATKVMLDAPEAPERCGGAIVRLFQLRYWLYLWRIIDDAASLLLTRGDADSAAVVIGHLQAPVPPWRNEPRNTTLALLNPHPRRDVRFSEGAAMGLDNLVRYTIDALARLHN